MKRRTLLLAGGGTGGHVFPLIAVADALSALAPEVHLVFVGTERGMEVNLVPERGYALELVRVSPLRGAGVAGALRGVWRAMTALPESHALLEKHAPRALLSIGGYAAGPISLAARLKRIPLALIEPNSVMGLANRLTVPLVQRAYVAFAGAAAHFSPRKVLTTGVPIRGGFEPQVYRKQPGLLEVLVLGGSQGAKSLNETVPEALCRVGAKLRVVHQCGAAHADAVRSLYQRLAPGFDWRVVPFIGDVPAALGAADLVISRSGASAVSEIAAVGRPALYVPYPHAAGDHQRHNALTLEQAGAAVTVPASEAKSERIAREVERLASTDGLLQQMARAAAHWGKPAAARAIALDLLELAGLRAEASASVTPKEPGRPDPGPKLAEVAG